MKNNILQQEKQALRDAMSQVMYLIAPGQKKRIILKAKEAEILLGDELFVTDHLLWPPVQQTQLTKAPRKIGEWLKIEILVEH